MSVTAVAEIKAADIDCDRDAVIARIRSALKRRSGKDWSVTGGRGTAWGWITVDAPPRRRTWQSRPLPHNRIALAPGKENWEEYDAGEPNHTTSPAERTELAQLLGLDTVHFQGVSIMSSHDAYREYVMRAEGQTPTKIAEPYWD